MKVKIIKSSLPSYWYSDKIGQTFDVYEELQKGFICSLKEDSLKVISFSDCEVIKNYPIGTRVFYNNGSYIAEKRKDGWYNTIGKQERVGIDESLIGTSYPITFDKTPPPEIVLNFPKKQPFTKSPKLFSSEDIKRIMGNNIMNYETLEYFLK